MKATRIIKAIVIYTSDKAGYITDIRGKYKLDNGMTVRFRCSHDYSTQQWGSNNDDLWFTISATKKYQARIGTRLERW
jgi:hypothetical protein